MITLECLLRRFPYIFLRLIVIVIVDLANLNNPTFLFFAEGFSAEAGDEAAVVRVCCLGIALFRQRNLVRFHLRIIQQLFPKNEPQRIRWTLAKFLGFLYEFVLNFSENWLILVVSGAGADS